jgi:hypothetical protein
VNNRLWSLPEPLYRHAGPPGVLTCGHIGKAGGRTASGVQAAVVQQWGYEGQAELNG